MLLERLDSARADLLEIAALLEHANDPDPAACREVRRLLTDGCASPLYNPQCHPSELKAALHYVRRDLDRGAPSLAVHVGRA